MYTDTSLKIGFLGQPFDHSGPPDPGGSIGIWTWEVARRLARSCQVIIAAPRKLFGSSVEQWEQVEFRRFLLASDHMRSALLKIVSVRSVEGPEFASASYYPLYAGHAARVFRAENCDVVHVHQYSQFVPVIRAANPTITIALHMHSDWLIQLDRDIIAQRIEQADVIIGCSDYVSNGIRGAFPQYAARCVTVFNGVDLNQIETKHRLVEKRSRYRIVFVGRVSPEKGLHVLIDAFNLVLDKCPDACLEIIGGEFVVPREYIIDISDDPMVQGLASFYDGSYLEALERQAQAKLNDRVIFLGYVSRATMIQRLRQADLFVQPSIASEMFGMAIAEAMAAGLPVVATRICGIPEVVADEETGLLVAPNDAIALAQAIVRLLSNDALSAQMGEAARARVERLFSWESTAHSLEQVYREVSLNRPNER